MPQTLIIGFGNIDRADDGVAFHVINRLRQRLGQVIIRDNTSGLEEMGAETDSIFLPQLTPELIDILSGYSLVIFVDAHVGRQMNDLHSEPVSDEYSPVTFSHHTNPAILLALYRTLYNQEIHGHIVSIRGHIFDFQRNLSDATDALIEPAVEKVLQICRNRR